MGEDNGFGAGVAIWRAVGLRDDCASRISYTTNVWEGSRALIATCTIDLDDAKRPYIT